jgi:hypothetical protein
MHRTVFAVDVEASTLRTDLERLALRRAMYAALEKALRSAGVPWAQSESIDRGDGL